MAPSAHDESLPMLEAVEDSVIVTDPNGRIAAWNGGAEALFGWTAKETIGRNIRDVVPRELSQEQTEKLFARLESGKSWQGHVVMRRRDGSPVVTHVSDSPLFDADGSLAGIVGVSQNLQALPGALRHLAFLAEVSRVLGSSLDYPQMVGEVTRVLVPGFADLCSIFINESGHCFRMAEAGFDLVAEGAMRALRGLTLPAPIKEIFERALEAGRARLVPDFGALVRTLVSPGDPYREALEPLGLTSAIIAPVLVRGKPLGAITLAMVQASERSFDNADRTYAEELADRIGVAIDNARLYRNAEAARLAVEQRESTLVEERRIFETLYRIGTSLATELDEQKLLQRVTDETTALTGAGFGVFLFNVMIGGESYTLYTLSGAAGEVFTRFRLPQATPLFGPTLRGEGVIRSDDVRTDPRFGQWGAQVKGGQLPVVSYLAVPVVTRSGDVLGRLMFTHGEAARFTQEHERLVVGIAGQAAIALENARLYTMLRESEANARDAYGLAREAERRKDDFLAMLGHELRNPLAPIVTALELLRMRGETGREAQIIERQVGHLVRLVDDLLDVARITRGKIELKRERVEMAHVVTRAIEIASPLIEQRAHHLTVDVPQGLEVFGDPTRLAQILSNLVANSAKYTDRGGHIEVRGWADHPMIEISVRDDGTGIEASILPAIFEAFVQSPRSSDRAHGGLGIGLTLVRSLVAMHGGSVEAKSDGLGQGSEFVVRLPLAENPAEAPAVSVMAPEVVAPVARGALRVLVVDDNADAAEMLSDALRAIGHDVSTADDGPAALRVAATFRPDVAVLDIGLPVMDGYELGERLRRTSHPPRCLIAVTGYGQADDRARGVAAGFDAHLVKPIDLDALERAIKPAQRSGGIEHALSESRDSCCQVPAIARRAVPAGPR